MLYKYEFGKTDFPNQKFDAFRLEFEIRESSITVALDSIIKDSDNDCYIYFKAELSAGEQTTLDTIVVAHSGELLPEISVPKMADGRPIVRADSRPIGTETCFTCVGDIPGNIGNGKKFFWDFSNDEDELPTGDSNYRMKQIDLTFNDTVWIKEGTLYVFDALKGSYCDFSIWAPPYYPYYDRQGNPAQAGAEGTMLYRYVHNHFFAGTIPMGDELNTEGCQQDGVPANYIIRGNIYVPSIDNASYGWCSVELYRTRTILFPGESL